MFDKANFFKNQSEKYKTRIKLFIFVDKENEATVRKLYGLSVVALVIVLWIGRSVTWRYDISFVNGTCRRKPRRISKKFEPSEIITRSN